LFCVSVAAWEGIVRALDVPVFIVPPPSKIAAALWRGFSTGVYIRHLAYTLLETILGFLLGSALGFTLGTAGLDPEKDITIVVAGEAAKAAALVRSKQVDALSLFDTQYALVDNAGVKVRMLDDQTVARYPSNGFLALEDALKSRRRQAVALARGYAMGTVFALANTEAGVRILYEVYPQTRPTGKDEATAVRDDTKVLLARADKWSLEKWGIKRWGENSEKNYAAYVDFMLKWGIIKQKVDAKDLVTNELIDEINTFDPKAIAAETKSYKPGG
ncbi:MAG TPA: hypothetical protein VEH53_08645, partial [archaeon]|nr:hypothetical protein [archaeon]